ncbi:Uncharacterized protein Fot_14341 [Forsythia ovata]|uniref:Uncharacterized protein n=1 Tax=Forsythia ovata TaxID=205694 RepID=A0ABD1W8E7_9LAMI
MELISTVGDSDRSHSERRKWRTEIASVIIDFGFSGDVMGLRVVPQQAVVAKEENGDSVQKVENSRQRAQVLRRRGLRLQEGGTTAPVFRRRQEWWLVPRKPGKTSRNLGHGFGDCVERERREQNGGGVFGGTKFGFNSTQLDNFF